ncbi:MAG: bifunctional nuclease family protein [Gemmatimonadota bacterium]|nr:bifunctional nuclease family protein [Gemmatimonadota bacterium]
MSDGRKDDAEGLVEVEVASLGLDKASNTPVVILRELGGEGLLPIWIGPGEASAIAMVLAGIRFSRPLTHDLLDSVVRSLGSELVRVLITRVEDNTYFASLVFRRGGEMLSIDARPSDSVALALRASAPIFAARSLLGRTSFEVTEPEEGTGPEAWAAMETPEGPAGPSKSRPGAGPSSRGEPDGEALREYLRGLDPEDFGRFVP